MTPFPVIRPQPGPAGKSHFLQIKTNETVSYVQKLYPGNSLDDALLSACISQNIHSAAVNLIGGMFESFEFCLAVEDQAKLNKIKYSSSQKIDGLVTLVCANATVGVDADGVPLVHCHGVVADKEGTSVGGHFFGNNIMIIEQPVTAFITGLCDVIFRQQYDPETDHSIFMPVQARHLCGKKR